MQTEESKNYLLFGHRYYQTFVDPKLYDKKSIIKTIHRNFKQSSNRNKFDDTLPISSNMHHSLYDTKNIKYEEPNYSSLNILYKKIFLKFIESIKTTSKLSFDFQIMSYTCTKSSHFMRRHNHLPSSDFSAVHYISFDSNHAKTVYYNPGNDLTLYNKDTRKNLYEKLDSNDISNYGYYEYCSPLVKEDYLVIVPAYMHHEIPSISSKYKKPRITIVTNIWIN